MSAGLTEAVEVAARYLFEESVKVAPAGHPAVGKTWDALSDKERADWREFDAQSIVARVAPIIRRQVAAEIIDALNADERDYVKPDHFDAYLAGLSAAKEIARRVGDPS